MGRWWPFVGGSLGYIYGDAVSDTWVAGPEAGVRYFVNETTFILGLVEYEFFFDNADEAERRIRRRPIRLYPRHGLPMVEECVPRRSEAACDSLGRPSFTRWTPSERPDIESHGN